eukprot:937466_1
MAMMALSEASNTPVNPIKITRLSVTSTQTRSPSDEMNRFPTKTSLLCHGKWIVIQENKTITIYNKNTGQTQPSFEGKCPVFGMQMLYFLVEPKLYIYHIRGDAFDDNGDITEHTYSLPKENDWIIRLIPQQNGLLCGVSQKGTIVVWDGNNGNLLLSEQVTETNVIAISDEKEDILIMDDAGDVSVVSIDEERIDAWLNLTCHVCNNTIHRNEYPAHLFQCMIHENSGDEDDDQDMDQGHDDDQNHNSADSAVRYALNAVL